MTSFFFRFWQFVRFYSRAITKYQLHSPFVFELATTALEDKRWYYAFRDIELVREKMLQSQIQLHLRDYGTGRDRSATLRTLASRPSSSTRQGRMLFRLANWANPRTMIELGTSVGLGTMYLASGARLTRFISLEGAPEAAQVARTNLELLGLNRHATVLDGPFETKLPEALQSLGTLDFVFFDGNHRQAPTMAYFEQCLAHAHAGTVFVFDDMHWSAEMAKTWAQLQAHPRVTLSIDFFELSLIFVNPDFKQKQHLYIVPAYWKIWKFL